MLQLGAKAGVFACDAHTIFTNESVLEGQLITPELVSAAAGANLFVMNMSLQGHGTGAYTNTPMNTKVFQNVWNYIFEKGAWEQYEWTVKVDPDTVFKPQYLKSKLVSICPVAEYCEAQYLQNCPGGCHGYKFIGPLEVLSKQAVERFKSGVARCYERGSRGRNLFDTDKYGEDVFVDWCLSK